MGKVININKKENCIYCGSEEGHPDLTCPRIVQAALYPSGSWTVIFDKEFYDGGELQVDLEFDPGDDDPVA